MNTLPGGLWLIDPQYFSTLTRPMAVGHTPTLSARAVVENIPSRHAGKNVAVIQITGLLTKGSNYYGGTSTVSVRRAVRAAAADPTVSAICLAIDSPGGTVSGTDSLAADVREAAKSKRVVAQVEDLCASAAYWVASACDAIYVNSATAQVGSIGTMNLVYDTSAAAEKQGVKVHVFATGPLKGAGADGHPISEAHAEDYQARVNAIQVHFDAAVKHGRGLTREQLAAVKTGGVFPATQALSLKLIDGVQSLDVTLAKLSRAA